MAGIFGKLFSEEQRELSALEKIADQVLKYEPEMQALSDDELRAKTDEYRKIYRRINHIETLLSSISGAGTSGSGDVCIYPEISGETGI